MFKPATIKLTLWYALIAILLSLVFSVVLYRIDTNELSEGLKQQYNTIVTNDHDSDDFKNVSETDLNKSSKQLVTDLVYFNLVVLIGALVASYTLARRTLKPIEEAHLAQVRFTAEASHELRTPLSSMRAGIEATLMQKNDNQKLRLALEDNLKDIDRLDRLTDQLLNIARYNKRSAKPTGNVNLKEVINNVIINLSSQIDGKDIKLGVNAESVYVVGDAGSLEQVLTIIVDNSIKYSEQKSTIQIDLHKKNKRVILSVKDSGIGIPSSDLPHIFESFYRSKKVVGRSHKSSGYGLGLSLAKAITEFNHGNITISSKESQGTTVVLSFPLV